MPTQTLSTANDTLAELASVNLQLYDLMDKRFELLELLYKQRRKIVKDQEVIGKRLPASITTLQLSVRTANCLRAESIYTLGDLLEHAENDLLRTPNLGRRAVTEIQKALQLQGQSLPEKSSTRLRARWQFEATTNFCWKLQRQAKKLQTAVNI